MQTEHRLIVERLLKENLRGLVLFARQWAGAAAEDVVQDAFVKLLNEENCPESPKAWLYRVARNGAIDRQRKENRFKNDPERLADWFEQVDEKPFDGEALTKALESLDADIREIVVAKIWGDLPFREIAELSGRPISSVHWDYQRGLDRLRNILKNDEH